MRSTKRLLLGAATALLPAFLAAQAIPLAPEFQANTYTTGAQVEPAIASSGDGGFVIVWTSQEQDGSEYGIFGQRFGPLGAKLGAEFLVNTHTTGRQHQREIAADRAGNFVVVWVSQGQDGSGYGVFGQRFDSSGVKAGAEFRANTYTTGDQRNPRVAVDGAGNFIVVWHSSGQDGSDYGVFGQRFAASGAKIGGEFSVNSYTTGPQDSPALFAGEAGDFVVVWEDWSQDGSSAGIFGQRFDASGAKSGPEFQINTYTTERQASAQIAADRAGNFVVVWESNFQDGSFGGIFGQRFNRSGERLGAEFPVNTFTTDRQLLPSVAIERNGGFAVVWTSNSQDGSNGGIFGQRFDPSGARIGPEFPVNTYTTGLQWAPRIVDDGFGVTVTWWSQSQDGSIASAVGRRQDFFAQAMQVDAHPSPTSSDANGVLEPGETVLVEPAWTISRGFPTTTEHLTGTASNFSGPAGALYLLPSDSADYGTLGSKILSRFTRNCYDATAAHDCPVVGVVATGDRPAGHWDSSFVEQLSTNGGNLWRLHIGDSFSDVPRSQPFYKKIETVLHAGITSGCGGSTYCPGDPVARDQMAIFIAKGIAGSGEKVPASGIFSGLSYNCAGGGNSLFLDIAPTDSFCKHVHYIASQNVTLGCNTATYCPSQTVTRDAMASFIAKAVVAPGGGNAVPLTYGPDPVTGLSYSCDAGSPNVHFTDVPVTNLFCKHIHYLWAKGVIAGCSATQYCPSQPVNRDAMAKFLANGFGLQLYGP